MAQKVHDTANSSWIHAVYKHKYSFLLFLSFATFMTQLWKEEKGLPEVEAIFCVSLSSSLYIFIRDIIRHVVMSSCAKTNYPKTKIICENVRDSYSFTASIAS